ncbi:MAG: hypothetical protein OWQ54_07465 [Sulfolobaceae archaeon]|nr:hypothetical protein [Sulfolobaceae archaeon]
MKRLVLALLTVAIALIASGIVLHSMDHLVHTKLTLVISTVISTANVSLPTIARPPLYAQLWFGPLAAGLVLLVFLVVKRFKL